MLSLPKAWVYSLVGELRCHKPCGTKKKKKIEKLKYRVKKLFSSTGCHELEVEIRVFPGGPVVKNLPSDAEYVGSVPDQGTKDSTCCSAAKPGSHNY